MASRPRGANTISTRIALDGDAEIKLRLQQLGQAGERAFAALKTAADKASDGVGGRFDAAFTRLRTNLAQLQQAGVRVGAAVSNLQGAFARLGASIATVVTRFGLLTAAALGTLAAFLKLGKSAIDVVDAADRQAQALGLTIEGYSGLAAAAEQASIGQDEFATAITRLNVALGKAREEGSKSSSALEEQLGGLVDTSIKVIRGAQSLSQESVKGSSALQRLGIRTRDANGQLRATDQILLDIADKFQAMPDGVQKSALAVELFGRSGVRLIPFLNDGREGIQRLIEDARRMGVVFTEQDKQIAAFADRGLDRLTLAIKGVRTQLGLLFAPAIGAGSNVLADFIRDNMELLREFGRAIVDNGIVLIFDFIQAFAGFDEDVDFKWVLTFRDALIALGETARAVIFDILLPAFEIIQTAAQAVADTINNLFGTEFTANQVLVAAAVLKLSGALGVLAAAFGVVTGAINLAMALFVPLAPLLRTLWSGFALLGRGITLVVAGLAGLLGLPVAVTAAIVAAVIAAGVALFVYWDEIKASAKEVWDYAVLQAQGFVNKTAEILAGAGNLLDPAWQAIRQSSEETWSDVGLQAEGFINKTVQIFGDGSFLNDAWAGITNGATSAFSMVEDIASGVGGLIERLSTINLEDVFSAEGAAAFRETLAAAFAPIDGLTSTIIEGAQKAWDGIVAGLAELGPRLAPLWEAVKEGAAGIWTGLSDAARTAWDNIIGVITEAAGNVASAVGTVATAAFDAFTGAGQTVADSAQQILDTLIRAREASQSVAGAQNIAAALAKPFADAKVQIDIIFLQIEQAANALLLRIQAAFQAGSAQIVGIISLLGNAASLALSGALAGLGTLFSGVTDQILSAWSGMVESMASEIKSLVSVARSVANEIASIINSILAKLRSARSAASSSSSSVKRSGGGPVFGAGTGTSDSIPAWLSHGEFVIRADAVRRYGLRFLYALNSMRLSPEIFPRFRHGGLAHAFSHAFAPAFALGGLAVPVRSPAAGRPVTLVLPGGERVTGITASEDAVDQLGRFASRAKMTSAGRKPGFYGY